MADGVSIQAKINKGYGTAGRKVGLPHEHFRPSDAFSPLALLNHIGTLLVAVDARPSYAFSIPALHSDAERYILADGRLLQHGDYLVGPQETVFVAALPMLQPIVCIACNAVLSLRRTAEPEFGPIDEPVRPTGEVEMWAHWPASLLYAGRGGGDDMTVPGDSPPASFNVLLPSIPGVDPPRSGDVLVDERGRRFAVSWAEVTGLGWRMNARILTVA